MSGLRQLRRQLRAQPFYQRGKRLLRRLAGRELWLRPDTAEPVRLVAGWLLCDRRLPASPRVFGLGVGSNVDFELALIRDHGALVDTFDPTPFSNEWLATRTLPPGFHHYPWAVTATDGPVRLEQRKATKPGAAPMLSIVAARDGGSGALTVEGLRLPTIARRLGCPVPDLLRMDIEGAEYAVLDDMVATGFLPPQLLVEFHHRFAEVGLDATRRAVRALRSAGYRLAAVSDTGRELTFIRPA